MLNAPMPFTPCPCSIWLPHWSEPDAYNNSYPEFTTEPDITTTCCYAPGYARVETTDEREQGAPFADGVRMMFFLPKTLHASLRGARIACATADDEQMAAKVFDIVGDPVSYPRASTPGDYSWMVEGVVHLG